MRSIAFSLIAALAAAPASAQQEPPARVPPPAPAARPVETRPVGSVLRCKDGVWAPAGATDASCASHGGVGYRLRQIIPPPAALARPETTTTAAVPAPPTGSGLVEQSTVTTIRPSATRAGVQQQKGPPGRPPADATLLCMDGTFLTGAAEPSRCSSHGGLTAILPKKKP